MAEKLDPKQVATFEELLRSMMYEQEALRRVLVRTGVLTNEEVMGEVKAVQCEAEGEERYEGNQSRKLATILWPGCSF